MKTFKFEVSIDIHDYASTNNAWAKAYEFINVMSDLLAVFGIQMRATEIKE